MHLIEKGIMCFTELNFFGIIKGEKRTSVSFMITFLSE